MEYRNCLAFYIIFILCYVAFLTTRFGKFGVFKAWFVKGKLFGFFFWCHIAIFIAKFDKFGFLEPALKQKNCLVFLSIFIWCYIAFLVAKFEKFGFFSAGYGTEKLFGFLYYFYLVLHCLFYCQIREIWHLFILTCDRNCFAFYIIIILCYVVLFIAKFRKFDFIQHGLNREIVWLFPILSLVFSCIFDCQIRKIWQFSTWFEIEKLSGFFLSFSLATLPS